MVTTAAATMAAATASASGLFKVKARDLAFHKLISSLHLSRTVSQSSSFTWKPARASAMTSSSSSFFPSNLRPRQSYPFLAPFCTGAPKTELAATEETEEEEKKKKSEEGKENLIETSNLLEIRVGRILKAWRHEEADSLYVEEVDIGEPEPRIICSGLVKYVPLDLLQDAAVVVLANLKTRNMRGVKSSGMLLAASDAAHENVELLVPPEGSVPGDRVWFGNEDDLQQLPDPASPNQIQKKKIWESMQPHLKTDSSGIAMLGEHLMRAHSGVVTSKSLKNANIS